MIKTISRQEKNMALPIQLKFFKKIELYQEYKSEERKVKISRTRLQRWQAEKEILKWTALEHHHPGSPIGNRRIKEEILENKYSLAYEHAIDAMVQIDYATKVSEPELGIKMTKEGLLMGEVINEVESIWLVTGLGYRLKYFMLFLLVWITAIAGALIVIINAWKLIYPILQPLFAQVVSVCS